MRGLSNPTSIAFRPDGRIYITLKNGTIRVVNPTTGDTSTAASLPVGNAREDGLHSLVRRRPDRSRRRSACAGWAIPT
jgi:DNA-binding beta-propeller fold protein YncE